MVSAKREILVHVWSGPCPNKCEVIYTSKRPSDYSLKPKNGKNTPSIWNWGSMKMKVPSYAKDDNDMVLVMEGDRPGYIAMRLTPGFSESLKKQTTRQRPKAIEDVVSIK